MFLSNHFLFFPYTAKLFLLSEMDGPAHLNTHTAIGPVPESAFHMCLLRAAVIGPATSSHSRFFTCPSRPATPSQARSALAACLTGLASPSRTIYKIEDCFVKTMVRHPYSIPVTRNIHGEVTLASKLRKRVRAMWISSE